MKLIYENESGRITMRGGTGADFNITEITGLSFPDTAVQTVRYPGVPGQTVTGISHFPRTITISGDIKDERGVLTSRAATVFSSPGTLFVISNRNSRKIECRCTNFEPKKRQGIYVPFVMQLVSDYPYFEDVSENCESILKKEKLLCGTVTFPEVFSKRLNEARIVNQGIYKNEPVFKINTVNYAECPDGIIIENLTTGQKLTLSTDVLEGETITIDVGERKITSDLRGNMIGVMAQNDMLSRMYLAVGINDILVTATNEKEMLLITCTHKNGYVEAVF